MSHSRNKASKLNKNKNKNRIPKNVIFEYYYLFKYLKLNNDILIKSTFSAF